MFSPLTTARHLIATTRLTSPDDIAEQVAAQTPPDDVPVLYQRLLRDVAREAIRLENMGATQPPRTVPNRSSRVQAIKQAHTTYYDQRVFAGGVWKLLGDCSVEDVQDLVAQRIDVAARNMAKAKEFEVLVDRMERAGVMTVRGLDKVAA